MDPVGFEPPVATCVQGWRCCRQAIPSDARESVTLLRSTANHDLSRMRVTFVRYAGIRVEVPDRRGA